MGPAIDTSAPADYVHFHYNAKRAMQQAERLYDIERVRPAAAYTITTGMCPGTCVGKVVDLRHAPLDRSKGVSLAAHTTLLKSLQHEHAARLCDARRILPLR